MRPDRRPVEEDNQDSFLDVVANVVGILIILVMLVGVRASYEEMAAPDAPPSPPTVDGPDLQRLREQLATATEQAIASQRSLDETATRVVALAHEAARHDQRRVELAMHRSVIEQDLERRRSQLDTARQRDFDVQRQLVESQLELDELTQEQLNLAGAPGEVEQIECIPTPLAKVVEGSAIHLRLERGLVSIVPLEELLAEVTYQVEDIRRRLRNQPRVVTTLGPLDGYRLKFTVATRTPTASIGGPRVGQLQRTVHDQFAEVIPISDTLGQSVEQALMKGSALYEHLQSHRRGRTPVVVWLYTDSFDEFRPLKRALWEMGFSLATRPMRPGTHIGASPHGTKAAAQ